jgi:hypothetical protein
MGAIIVARDGLDDVPLHTTSPGSIAVAVPDLVVSDLSN